MSDRVDGALLRAWEREIARCSEDPAYYIFNHVKTKDERDRHHPVKPFPDKAYLREQLDAWHTGEPVEFTIKSRQLTISWLAVAYASWVARFHDHSAVLVRSKREADALKMVFVNTPTVGRLSFIETNLPPWLQQKVTWVHGQGIYPNGSIVEAVPQGPAHAESRVLALLIDDECSLQDEWAAGYAAAIPCTEKYVGISTVRIPSAFSEEVRIGAEDRHEIARGIWTTRSASNIHTTWLHYTADPDKDPQRSGEDWFKEESSRAIGGIEGHHWQQHMEMNFDVVAGTRLIPDFEKYESVLTCDPIPREKQIGWRYYAGFDYGKRNKTVLGVYGITPDDHTYVVYEVAGSGDELGGHMGIAEKIKTSPYFDDIRGRIYADPSIWNRNQSTVRGYTSVAELLQGRGVTLRKAPTFGSAADDIAIERLLYWYWEDRDNPKLQIFRTCKTHITQWKGLRWKDLAPAQAQYRGTPEVLIDKNNDSFDAWKYAECQRPNPRSFRRVAPVGSAEYYREKIRAEAAPRKRHLGGYAA